MKTQTLSHRLPLRALAALAWVLFAGARAVCDAAEPPHLPPAQAKEILDASGIKGGLIVHLGCGNGKLTAALRADDRFVVQGLDADVTAARQHIQSLGLYGPVSAEQWTGERLPFVDNLVNLVVADDLGKLPMGEVTRVLVPNGVALIGGKKTVKPRPATIDEWTHFLHDPQGTAVSDDMLIGRPHGLQWTDGPFWARSHEHTASLQAMVAAGGRAFHVLDEGPIESIQLPSHMVLTARDAFNGVVLWKRSLHDWGNPLYPLKSGPGWLPRRLVAVGDRVFLAPGLGQNLVCLDAATGKVLTEYEETASTFELIVSDGVVLAAVAPDEKACDYNQQNANCWTEQRRASALYAWKREDTRILKAFKADGGPLLWQVKLPIAPMSLIADAKMVCLLDGQAVVALDRTDGKQLWRTDVPPMNKILTGYSGPRMVLHKDQVIYSPMGMLFALDAKTGRLRWKVDRKPRSGHFCLEDFFILEDQAWVLGGSRGTFSVYSLQTGQKVAEHDNPINSFYIHQRCYPGRATQRLLLPPVMGTTVYDIQNDRWSIDNWVRGGCVYGTMLANGMLYTPPSACACYYQSKLNGFNAVSPVAQSAEAPAASQRRVKGPAYGTWDEQSEDGSGDWPVFRHDNNRSGYARTDVPADVSVVWRKHLAAKLSQPVAAGGKLYLAAVDEHTVFSLDAKTGQESWHFTAGGRIDSPPTLYHGLAIFGCADGCVYALSAADGKLAWRFQAAPNDRKLISYGQLESVWPLSGSVLIQDSKLYCVAGRSMFLDGGIRMVILAPKTGELLSENVMDRRVPGTDKDLQDLLMGKHMPVARPDILVGDGRYIYMKSETFTPDGKRLRIVPQRPDVQYGEEVHLFSPISFLDDAWNQREYWIYGRAAGEGWAEFQLPPRRIPYGRIICLDEQNAYGYGREPELICNTSVSEYRLYSANKIPARQVGIPKLEGKWVKSEYPTNNPLAPNSVDWKRLARMPREKLSALTYHWIHDQPDVIAKAMVLAGDRLFLAGPKDVVDEKAMWGRSKEPQFQQKMAEQADWLNGKHGSFLQIFAKQDGKKLGQLKLDCLPAFDGLIAANRSLYMVTRDGSILCLRGNSQLRASTGNAASKDG